MMDSLIKQYNEARKINNNFCVELKKLTNRLLLGYDESFEQDKNERLPNLLNIDSINDDLNWIARCLLIKNNEEGKFFFGKTRNSNGGTIWLSDNKNKTIGFVDKVTSSNHCVMVKPFKHKYGRYYKPLKDSQLLNGIIENNFVTCINDIRVAIDDTYEEYNKRAKDELVVVNSKPLKNNFIYTHEWRSEGQDYLTKNKIEGVKTTFKPTIIGNKTKCERWITGEYKIELYCLDEKFNYSIARMPNNLNVEWHEINKPIIKECLRQYKVVRRAQLKNEKKMCDSTKKIMNIYDKYGYSKYVVARKLLSK